MLGKTIEYHNIIFPEVKATMEELTANQSFNSHEWPRQNFSLQYQYNNKQTGDENREKYKFEDFLIDPVPNSQN